jgi:ATP-dependent Lhr-like helicase
LAALEPTWTVIPDNYAIKVRGGGDIGTRLQEAIERLAAEDFWNDEAIWTTLRSALPNYRLTKFQPLMPSWVERETVANHLLDIPGTKQWLRSQTTE